MNKKVLKMRVIEVGEEIPCSVDAILQTEKLTENKLRVFYIGYEDI